MRMLRLTDAISAVEGLEHKDTYGHDQETIKSIQLAILERLINAEHVEVNQDNLRFLQRMGLWRDNHNTKFKQMYLGEWKETK